MPYVIAIVVIVALVALFVYMRSRSGAGPAGGEAAGGEDVPTGLRPTARDFHVAQGAARVYFSVPIPPGDPDPVLAQILLREAVEVLRSKRSSLPLEGVSRVHAYGLRGDDPVEVGSLTLDGPGELPPPPAPGDHPLIPRGAGPDLFDGDAAPYEGGVESRVPDDELSPLTTELRFPSVVEAGLRTQGIDPVSTTVTALVPGLLRLAGYTVRGEGATLVATKDGVDHYVEVVEHQPGSHPELSEQAVDSFLLRFGQAPASRGLLFTEKFGPFVISEKERRTGTVRFITRERFQRWVDAISLG